MMRVPTHARVWMAMTTSLGLGVVVLATVRGALAPLTTLALLAAAALLAELFQVDGDERSLDPRDAHSSSFSTGVHFAAVLIVGPWAAAVVAAFGVLFVDRMRGASWSKLAFNASNFALATFAGGQAFQLAGGVPGVLDLPAKLGAVAVLAGVYGAVNAILIGGIIAFTSGRRISRTIFGAFRSELPTTIAEVGLGVLVAVCALKSPWAVAALVPLLIADYQARYRLAMLRRETARALETFANVVDERDPYTFDHSARVGEYVRRLAKALGLPATDVFRLHWAGRLHDLGKISVDTSVLRKPGKLDADEWASLRLHPRLSSRLLQRFRFAADEARAVEYHHERFDGRGYYGIEPKNIPLAAHFLIVADSYDAMRSDRPYRRGLPKEQALGEIEANAGSQFHPAVAKAFVALERGVDPLAALSPAEQADLRRLSARQSLKRRFAAASLLDHPDLFAVGAVAAALFLAGFREFPFAAAALAAGVCAVAWRRVQMLRGTRLAARLERALMTPGPAEALFNDLASRLAYSSQLRWAGLVSWSADSLTGETELEWGSSTEAPTETAITSWLIRETEADGELVIGHDAELGREGPHVALPLVQEGSTSGYLVLVFGRSLPRHVEIALRRCSERLSGAFPALGREDSRQRLAAVS